MIKFFDTNKSKDALNEFKHKIDALTISGEFEKERNNLIHFVVKSMENRPDVWDKCCQINIKWIGSSFNDNISNKKELTKENLDNICSMCFRFYFELYLSTKSDDDLSIDFDDARRIVYNNMGFFEKLAKTQIEYAIRDMPVSILRSIVNSDSIKTIHDFNGVLAKAEKSKKDWDNDLTEREKRVNKLGDALLKYENAFNFVGLYQGFDDLAKEKQKERDGILNWLRGLSGLIVAPIILQMIFVYNHIDDISAVGYGLALLTLSTFSLVAIAIYYFRVLLFNYKSVKSQLLQIDLRKTLCRFIQSYATYSSEIKKQDSKSLEKFESIIFSGIVAEDRSMPSTFDGGEQFGKWIGRFIKSEDNRG